MIEAPALAEPLLFVCRLAGEPGPHPEIGATLILLRTPHGPAAQAFESFELAQAVWLLYGAAAGAFLLPEPKLTRELRAVLDEVPVVVYRTAKDYTGATMNDLDFPWPERLVRFARKSSGC